MTGGTSTGGAAEATGAETRVLRGGRVLDDGALVARDVIVAAGQIRSLVVPGAAVDGADAVDASGLLVLPGLIDAHAHSYAHLCRDAVADDVLEAWLPRAAVSAASACRPAAAVGAQLTALDALRHGATTVLDHATLGADHADALVAAYAAVGSRVVLAAQVADVGFADSLHGLGADRRATIAAADRRVAATRASQTDACGALIDAAAGHARVTVLLGPSAPERCSGALLDDVAQLAGDHGLGLHVHLLETPQQRAGGDPLGTLAAHGLLHAGLSLAHCVHLDAPDVDRIAAAGAAVVHNPTSNLALGSGRLDLRRLLDGGIRVGLGCDGWTTGGTQDVLAQARLALIGRRPDEDPSRWLTPAEVWPLAAAVGADAIGLGAGAGRLEPGSPADFLLVDPVRAGLLHGVDPVTQLVLGGFGAGLVEAWVDGEVVLRDGASTRIDEPRVMARAAELVGELRDAAAPLHPMAAQLGRLTRP